MSRVLRRLGLAAALVGLACPTPGPTPPPTVAPQDVDLSLPADVFVQATGHGATEDEAYAAARAALAEAVLGDAIWAEVVTLELHRRGTDPQKVASEGDGKVVALGLTRDRVSVAISDFENGEPMVPGPEVWAEPLMAYLRAHIAAQACERRTALFEVQCEPGQTDEADAAVVRLMEGLTLTSAYPDGVPVDAEGRALREPVVFALWGGVPVAELPLWVEAPDSAALVEPRVLSDAQGRARLSLVEGVALPPLQVKVDTDALLGPHPAGLPRVELSIEPRTTGVRRWGLVVIQTTDHGNAPDGAAEVLRARMKAAGLGAPVRLTDRDARSLRSTTADRMGSAVVRLADAMSGRLDVLLVLSCDTRFANRMGGGRVWYEAEGTLRALDVWTGTVLAEASATVGADGVGDTGADAAARDKLAKQLAQTVIEALPRER